VRLPCQNWALIKDSAFGRCRLQRRVRRRTKMTSTGWQKDIEACGAGDVPSLGPWAWGFWARRSRSPCTFSIPARMGFQRQCSQRGCIPKRWGERCHVGGCIFRIHKQCWVAAKSARRYPYECARKGVSVLQLFFVGRAVRAVLALARQRRVRRASPTRLPDCRPMPRPCGKLTRNAPVSSPGTRSDVGLVFVTLDSGATP
jgi:hypothetical protein